MQGTVGIGEAARELKISVDTLRQWEKKGYVTPIRSNNNQRRYDLAKLKKIVIPTIKSPQGRKKS